MASEVNGVEPLQPGPTEELRIGSTLAEMQQLPPWVESLSAGYALGAKLSFAIQLCLEEVVSNVIRHGYGEKPGHEVILHCLVEDPATLTFTVEDQASAFDPLEAAASAPEAPPDPLQIGGQGIRLVRKFADSVEYEAKPGGNLLRLRFTRQDPQTA